jgi:hypothetical protein
MWEIWNEPNWGQDLSPQAHPGSTALESPAIYRGLLNAVWTGLGRTGYGHDTIMIGSLSPRGHSQPEYALASYPLTFVRLMHCVDGSGQQLRGRARGGESVSDNGRCVTDVPGGEAGPVQGKRVRRSPISVQPAADPIGLA